MQRARPSPTAPPTASTRPTPAPLGGARRGTSLLVPLDDLGIAHARRVRVASRLAQRAPLAQEVPALVEPDLDRLEPPVLGLGQAAFGAALVELVLLGDELLDAVVDSLVFHSYLPDGTSSWYSGCRSM